MFKLSLLAVGALALAAQLNTPPDEEVCYGPPYGETVKPTHEVTVVVVSVHWQSNLEQLRMLHDDPDAIGLSQCEVQEEQNIAFCDLYVMKPTHVYGDQQMDTLGHELLHGLLGEFHD